MNQNEICEIVDLLKDAVATKDWEIVDEAIMYMKDHCPEYEEDTEE
jgi:hypothetical protein